MRTPCQGRCCIVGGVCPGCGRTLEEVRNWTAMSDAERDEVMDRLAPSEEEPGEHFLIQVGWAGRFPRFDCGDPPEGTDRITQGKWFTYEEARDRYRANRAETPWPFRIVRLGRDKKDRLDVQKLPTPERHAARDLRTRMITEGKAHEQE